MPTICPFAILTGTACPGCGMTRALVALAGGDLDAALFLHPLAPLVLAELVVLVGWFALRRLGIRLPSSTRWLAPVVGVSGVLLVTVWIARLAAGTLPPV